MNNTLEIIPSPGTENKTWEEIAAKIELIKPFVSTIHIDVVDGIFAPNITFSDPTAFSKYTKSLFFEVHLMTDNPIQYVKIWADAGFKRFIGQIEKMPDQEAFIQTTHQYGEVGLAVDGPTNSDTLDFETTPDCILVMSINAGFSGQTFQFEQTDKIKRVKKAFSVPIEIDGGMNTETVQLAKDTGATRFVVTSAIFGKENPLHALKKLQALI